ncbi:leucine-rich repeat, immunoglobulin-like domain and transmembrane domain-containing protein 3b [Stigmatopora nigra]
MYLVFFLHILLDRFLVVHTCPSFCTCSNGTSGTAELRWVQCGDPRISTVPANVPADTVRLRLEKTGVTRVPRAAFFNLSELLFLWLAYNAIAWIHPSSFVNLRALRELRLDGNGLTAFPWEGLRDTPRLRTLGLHNNRLASLPAHAALFLLNVTYLDLSSNRLTALSAELLDLWFPIPGREERSVPRRILGLHDNPWWCDCRLSLMVSLSTSPASPVVLTDRTLTCKGSPTGTRAPFPRCARPSVRPSATRVVSLRGSNVILRCHATGYPTPTLTWVKTSKRADCCGRDVPGGGEEVPRNLESSLQGSPRVGVRWSLISLDDLASKDAGEYRCRARNMAGISEAPVKLTVVGVTRISGRPPKKSQRTPLKKPKRTRMTLSLAPPPYQKKLSIYN